MSQSNPKSKSSSSSSRPKTLTGSRAVSNMIRFSKDQINSAAIGVRKRYTGKGGSLAMARDLSRLAMSVNTEEKQIYTISTAQSVLSTTSIIYGIGTMAQGNGGNQRSGDSVRICNIDLNLWFYYYSGTAATMGVQNQIFNWYLVRYLKTPSTSGTSSFTMSEFLNVDGNGNYTPLSFPNSDTNENFQVMSSGTVDVQLYNNPTANMYGSKLVNIRHPCSFHQDYTGSGSTTICDGMCFVVVTALNPINAGGGSSVVINAAMWYVDN